MSVGTRTAQAGMMADGSPIILDCRKSQKLRSQQQSEWDVVRTRSESTVVSPTCLLQWEAGAERVSQ